MHPRDAQDMDDAQIPVIVQIGLIIAIGIFR